MNIDSVLKKEGIVVKNKLSSQQVNKIAKIISQKICSSFPEHNLTVNNIYSNLSSLNMYLANMPADSAAAKYFYKNNSIYFRTKMNFDNMDTIIIHECLHSLQEIKDNRGKLVRMGLYDVSKHKGQGINEAAVQLMAAIATNLETDTVKYYNLNFSTNSSLYYPLEVALINQIAYFTGTYPLFHSTLHSNNVFKNTFIAKSSEKAYQTIEHNFDTLIEQEETLSFYQAQLSQTENNGGKSKKILGKIESIKRNIMKITLETQELIVKNGFNSDLELVKDSASLNEFQDKLYNFKHLLISNNSYTFFNDFYREMINKLEEKRELIKQFGILTHLTDMQLELLDLQKDHFGIGFFRRLFDKLRLLMEDAVREKDM